MRLLVVGICTRAPAASARRSGSIDIVGLDYFGDRDQRRDGETYALGRDFGLAPAPRNLLRAAAALRYDAVAYAASLENHPALVAALAVGGGAGARLLAGNSPTTLARVRHVPSLLRACRRAGVAFPPTLLRSTPPPEAEPLASLAPRWLRKPRAAGGGWGVRDWTPADGPPSAAAGACLQRYVPGRSFSATFLANGRDAVLVGLAEGLAGLPRFGARGFGYCGSLVPPGGDPRSWVDLLPRLGQAATALTRTFGLVGLNGMDLIAGPAERDIALLEVNPRYSASMELIERAYNLPLFDWHLGAVARGSLPRFDLAAALLATPGRWGKAIVFARDTVVIPPTDSWLDAGVRDVPHTGDTIPAGAPICTVFAHASAQPDDGCLAGLTTRAAWIERQLQSPAPEAPRPGAEFPLPLPVPVPLSPLSRSGR